MNNLKLRKLFLLLFTVTFFVGSCASSSDEEGDETNDSTATEEVGESENKAHSDEMHWSYEGETGPEHWAELPDCEMCAGNSQSPVDIAEVIGDENLQALAISYTAANEFNAVNNGHTVQVNYPDGSTLTVDGTPFTLKQFHFHCPSEHTMNGEPLPSEVHLVHLDEAGNIAVIGIFIKEGAENPFFAKLWEHLPAEFNTDVSEVALEFDINEILPEDKGYFTYSGSLTTPPCTEGVKWFVMKNAIEASAAQIEALAGMMPANNARPVQPLNRRTIKATK